MWRKLSIFVHDKMRRRIVVDKANTGCSKCPLWIRNLNISARSRPNELKLLAVMETY
jgi:hypothetical protein